MSLDPDIRCDAEDGQSTGEGVRWCGFVPEEYFGSRNMIITDDESIVSSVTPVFKDYASEDENDGVDAAVGREALEKRKEDKKKTKAERKLRKKEKRLKREKEE